MRALKRYGPDVVTILIVAACAVWYLKINFLRLIPGLPGDSDFSWYYRAGQAILNGHSPYEEPAWFYPPLTAFLMVPFALVNYVTARWIWLLLSNVFMLAGAWVTWSAVRRDRITICLIALIWAFGGAARESLMLGQMGPLLLLAVAMIFLRSESAEGIGTGIGLVLKYLPGIAAVALSLGRRWRALTVLGLSTVAGLVLPWAAMLLFPGPKTPTATRYWMGTPEIVSFSVPSVVLRILDPATRGPSVPHNWEYGNVAANLHLPQYQEWASVASGATVLAAGLLALLLACRGHLTVDQLPWAVAGLISLSLASAPVCWTHYQILQYPGAALVIAECLRRRAWAMAAAAALCAALLYPLPVNALTAYYNEHHAWSAASPATLYFWSSVTPAACLGLFAITLGMIRSTHSTRAVLM